MLALFCIMVNYTTEKKMTPFPPANINSQYFLKEGFSATCDKILIGPILYRSYTNKHSSSEFLSLVAVSHPEHIFRLALRHSTSNFRRRLFAALLPLTLIPPPLWQNKNPQLSQLMNSCERHGISDFLYVNILNIAFLVLWHLVSISLPFPL